MVAQLQFDPNELIDTSGVGWEEVLLAVAMVIAAAVVAAIVRRLVRTATLRWFDTQPDVAVFLGRLAGWFIVALGIVAALLTLGIQLGPVFLLLGVVMVILFLSARSLLENFGAGILLQAEKAFRLGDLVEIDGEQGSVLDITGRTTVIDTPDGRRIRVPNSEVLSEAIINFSERGALRSEITIGLAYGTDLDHARSVLLEVLHEVDGVSDDPPPEVFVTGFGDSSISFRLRYWHGATLPTTFLVTDRVARAADSALQREGLVIAFPQLVVRDPESPGEGG